MSLNSVYLKPVVIAKTEALTRRGLVAERGSSKIALNCGLASKQADRSVIEPCGHRLTTSSRVFVVTLKIVMMMMLLMILMMLMMSAG
jgi:hypothetical protein